MKTKEFITSFGSILHLPNDIYNELKEKVKELEKTQPNTYNVENGKEIVNQWFPKDSPEDIVSKLYEERN